MKMCIKKSYEMLIDEFKQLFYLEKKEINGKVRSEKQ
jgi:hypothetical protein